MSIFTWTTDGWQNNMEEMIKELEQMNVNNISIIVNISMPSENECHID